VKQETDTLCPTLAAKAARLAARLFLTTVATAASGAVANFFYERFFAPDLYAAGPPILRAAFALAITSPLILAGLIFLGLPLSFLLKRLGIENAISYAVTGALSGVAFGVILTQLHHTELLVTAASYGTTCALFWWWFRFKA
jgi:hypothetical protein